MTANVRLRWKVLCLCILALLSSSNAAVYLHEQSFIEIRHETTAADFGFSIGYQAGNSANLVIGAPHSSDSIGEVYTCSMKDIFQNEPKCTKVPTDLKNLAPDTVYGLIHPKQSFCLGASIAATPDYFLTCAPLWTTSYPYLYKNVTNGQLSIGTESIPTGTCFVYNTTDIYRYHGIVEQLKIMMKTNKSFSDIEAFRGGIGWTSLTDEVNDRMLLAKPSLALGDIGYTRLSNPLLETESIVLDKSNSNSEEKKRHASNKNFLLDKYENVGYGLAAGNFFSGSRQNETFYAFSMQDAYKGTKIGIVAFLDKNQNILSEKKKIKVSGPRASMFGAALSAADVNMDGLSDLLVGAPAHSADNRGYEAGALFIYLGGDMDTINSETRKKAIFAKKNAARFGSTIAVSDIDGDSLPEIFVSAPYEDSGSGAIYVFSGYDIRNTLLKSDEYKEFFISDLRLTQRIQMKTFKAFGYSLQVVSDQDENGCDELAVGAPRSASVILFKCIPSINATLSTKLLEEVVEEYDQKFTAKVCVNVSYHTKPVNITTHLSVTVDATGHGTTLEKTNFDIELSQRKASYCENFIVHFAHNVSGDYVFTAKLDTQLLHTDFYKSSGKTFKNTWVTLSPYSITNDSMHVTRRCAGDCIPKLQMNMQWASRNETTLNYILGSSESENVTIVVHNDGAGTYDACVRISVTGADVSNIPCGHDRDDSAVYRCHLARPLQRHADESINIVLNMSRFTNMDKHLRLEARLYDNCEHEKNNKTELNVNLILSAEDVYIDSSSHNITVTDVALQSQKIKTVNDTHEYTIVNERSILWKDINAIITLEKKPFIGKYKVSTTTNSACSEEDKGKLMQFRCTLDLKPHAVLKLYATTEILNERIVKNLNHGQVEISSNFSLSLTPLKTIEESLTTVIFYKKELSFANNKFYIILIAVILAILILALVAFILYKFGFFKRKSKKRLDSFKQSIRSRTQSVRQNEPGSDQSKLDEDDDGLDIEVIDESPFEVVDASQCPTPSRTADNAVLIHQEKQNSQK